MYSRNGNRFLKIDLPDFDYGEIVKRVDELDEAIRHSARSPYVQ